MPADERTIDQTLLTCRIIAGALVFGVVSFVTVAVVMRLGQAAAGAAVLSYVGVGAAAIAVIVRQIVPGIASGLAPQGGAASPAAGALALYQTRMIVGLAILEAAAFFNTIAYVLEGHWWSLVVVAVLVALMLGAFPTRTRLRQWVEDRGQLSAIGGEGVT
jgi:hypothetical protein